MRAWLIVSLLCACGASPPGAQVDAGAADASEAGVNCGFTLHCDPPTVCCNLTGGSHRCQSPAQQCLGQLYICDGTEDCPNSFCCEHLSGGSDCEPAGTVCDGRHMCHTGDECAPGEACCSGVPVAVGYGFCGRVCPVAP